MPMLLRKNYVIKGSDMMEEQVKKLINEVFDEVRALRRHLHMYPELSNREENTMAFISEYLTQLGIPHKTNVGGKGIVGVVGDPKAAFAVGIRADIDALPIQELNDLPYASKVPGVMHACGHDIHTAVLMGTAKILKGIEGQLPGAVKLFFQPAEEQGGGARQMIEEGCMLDPPVVRTIGFHVDATKPAGHIIFFPGQVNACSTGLRITVRGKTCHGSRPDKGVDAIIASAHVLTTVQTVVSRFVPPAKPAVITVGTIQGGTKGNIIADEVVMTGTIRTMDVETRDFIKEKLKMVVDGAAASCGAAAEINIKDGYPPIINDPGVTAVLQGVAAELLGSDSYTVKTESGMGGEDFSYFANEVPSSYFRMGILGDNGGYEQTLHNERFCPDEQCMKNAMLMEIMGALALLEEIKKERT